jgi:hypothetical protein
VDVEKTMTKVVYGSRCPLHQAAAAKEGRLATCKLLLEFDPEQMAVKTNDGSLPMHMLSQSEDDQAAVLNAFLSKFEEQQKSLPAEERKSGADWLKEKKKDGSLLLHLACSAGLSSMVICVCCCCCCARVGQRGEEWQRGCQARLVSCTERVCDRYREGV